MRAAWLVFALVLLAFAAMGCFPKRGAYPIDIFTEMHYSQTFRSQEPPRLDSVSGAEVFVPLGTDIALEVLEKRQREYVPAVARELYRVNCSVCHGIGGMGDGPIVPFLTAADSFYASQQGEAYRSPPNLLESRDKLSEEAVFAIVTSGIVVMPKFGLLLTEEERRDIVRYIFDRENGLAP